MNLPVFTTKLLNLKLIIEKSGAKSGQIIGDLGCGRSGHFVFTLSQITGQKGKVYAIDVIKNNLAVIDKESNNSGITNISTIWSDLEVFGATKLEDSSLDLVFLINTVHQAKKPVDLLREVTRITKKSAKIIIVDWSQNASTIGPIEGNKVDKLKLVDACKKIGLYLDSEFTAGQYHFGLVLTKI